MIDVKSSWGDYIMKKILTIGTTLLAGLSLAACGNQQSSTSTKSSTTQQTHGKYYFDGTTANLQDVKIKITGVKFYQGDETTNEKNVICFDYTITNKTDKDINALTGWQAVFNAYQDNKNLIARITRHWSNFELSFRILIILISIENSLPSGVEELQ